MYDTPSPQQRSGHDFNADPLKGTREITYRAGTLEEVASKMFFESRLTSEDMVQGFEYYDKEAAARVKLTTFTAYVLGVYYGSFSSGEGKGDVRYHSNLVQNTKTDIMQSSFFVNSERRTLAIGNYKSDIVPALEKEGRKGGFTRVIVAYIPELKEVRAIHLGATAEAGFVKAIAQARGISEHAASLFGLSDLTSEIWAFKYDGESEPVVFSPKDARNAPATIPATEKSKKIYFQPKLQCGVIRENNEKFAETFRSVSAMQTEYACYIASEQAYFREIWEKGYGPTPTPARKPERILNPDDFPTADLTDYENNLPELTELPF